MDDAAAAELMAFDDEVGREETVLVENVQRGVRSGLIGSGRLLIDSEHLVASFSESRAFQKRVHKAVSQRSL